MVILLRVPNLIPRLSGSKGEYPEQRFRLAIVSGPMAVAAFPPSVLVWLADPDRSCHQASISCRPPARHCLSPSHHTGVDAEITARPCVALVCSVCMVLVPILTEVPKVERAKEAQGEVAN